ncbi:hypothetical protein [Methylocucumis oryzae]|uniref:hypothetical protein n=1 Tax=Methylocucumis oryzae TaxID=1632867 RepID=UPI000AF10659
MKKLSIVLSCLAVLSATKVSADADTLKVCAAEDEMPYSNNKGEGFENKLASLLGQALNKKSPVCVLD